jgi:zinc protease
VRLTTLPNGLTVIVREDHSAPVVAAQAWCRAGSVDEGRWLGAGLSHVLEHMLFKGTTKREGHRIDQEVQEAGGYMNAYTSFDRTVYWINVPDTGVRTALDILADITCNAALPAEELAKEMDVIRREMDMCHDDPARRSSRRLFETAYTRSPYRFTVIGYPEVFNQLTRDDIVAYYREKYVPNNLFFVVAGNVRTEEVTEQIAEAFRDAKARPLPPIVLPEEPRQVAARETIEEGAVELAHLHYSWHIPDLRHPDVPPLDVLAVLLGSGRSSRLFRQVREELALVTGIDAWTYSPGNQGLVGISAVLEADKCDAAREAILAEVRRVQDQAVEADELAKVVKQFISGTLAARKTMLGQAQDLGSNWMAAGDLNFSERYLAAVKQVTPAVLQRVAREYFTTDNQTLYGLVPKGTGARVAHRIEVAEEQPVRRFDLPNGLRLLVKENHRLPFVDFRLVLRGGVLAETATDSGATQLLSRMLMQGTVRRTAEQIANEIESVGGHLDTYSANNTFGVNAEVLDGDFQLGLELLADVLLHPAFPEEALERERANQLAALHAQRDQMLQSGTRALRDLLYGAQGYGLDPLGSEESLAALTAAQLRAFHTRLTVPRNAVLAIYGAVEPEAVHRAVLEAFGAWTASDQPVNPMTSGKGPSCSGIERTVVTRDKKQGVLLIGFPSTTIDHPDRLALDLLQEACSDLGSRLFIRIRDHLGLAYYVGASHFSGLMPGYLAFYVGTEPDKLAQVEQELLREAALLRTEGLSLEEVKRAQAKILGQRKISRQELGSLAQTHALDELYGLGYANSEAEDRRYEALTVDDLKAVAAKYLTPDKYAVAIVRPE